MAMDLIMKTPAGHILTILLLSDKFTSTLSIQPLSRRFKGFFLVNPW
jgi:hypothetical protein